MAIPYVVVKIRFALPLVTVSALLTGCGSSPAAPDTGTAAIVPTGPQVFRMSVQTPCAEAGRTFLPMIYTRVSVARAGAEWVASASSAAAGDLEVRFHQSSTRVLANSFEIAGTVRNTGIHMPELIQSPPWEARANFGSDGRTSLTGFAFAAGFAGALTAGLDGLGTGSIVINDTAGHTCSATSFSWSVFPPQTP